jgi:hypothetical protein
VTARLIIPRAAELELCAPLLHRAWLLRAPARYMEAARAHYSCFFFSLYLSTRAREFYTHTPASPTHTLAPSTRTLASSTRLRASVARFFYSHAGVLSSHARVLYSHVGVLCSLARFSNSHARVSSPPASPRPTSYARALAARVALSMPPSPVSSEPSALLAPRSSPPLHPKVLAQSLHRKR